MGRKKKEMCPHCEQDEVYYEGRIMRCYKCGYYNDPDFPLRNPEEVTLEEMLLRSARAKGFRDTWRINKIQYSVYSPKGMVVPRFLKIGEQVKKARFEQRLSQVDLARMIEKRLWETPR